MPATLRTGHLVAALSLLSLSACAVPVARIGSNLSVGRGDTFWLELGSPRQPYLAVITPEDRTIVLVNDRIPGAPIRQAELLEMSRLLVDTSTATGIPFGDSGETSPVPVFTVSGSYHFLISNNLETEIENMDGFSVYVTYE